MFSLVRPGKLTTKSSMPCDLICKVSFRQKALTWETGASLDNFQEIILSGQLDIPGENVHEMP